MMWGWNGGMMGGWGFGGIWMIIFWAIIVGLVVWGIVALARHSGTNPVPVDDRRPLEIAKERYARGEISKEDYERIKRDID